MSFRRKRGHGSTSGPKKRGALLVCLLYAIVVFVAGKAAYDWTARERYLDNLHRSHVERCLQLSKRSMTAAEKSVCKVWL